MTRIFLAALILAFPMAANAADDLKVSQLEQDVRELRRQVQAQAQQIEELRRQTGRPVQLPGRAPPVTSAGPQDAIWLDASRWQSVKAGMTELEVIGLLGPPTSMRTREAERVLLYAIEIGSSGFLGGSVTMRDRVVTLVQRPVLQ